MAKRPTKSKTRNPGKPVSERVFRKYRQHFQDLLDRVVFDKLSNLDNRFDAVESGLVSAHKTFEDLHRRVVGLEEMPEKMRKLIEREMPSRPVQVTDEQFQMIYEAQRSDGRVSILRTELTAIDERVERLNYESSASWRAMQDYISTIEEQQKNLAASVDTRAIQQRVDELEQLFNRPLIKFLFRIFRVKVSQ